MTQHPSYDYENTHYCAVFKDEPFSVCDLCRSIAVSDQYADVMSILALRCVTGQRIQMFFPCLTAAFDAHLLTRCIVGRGVAETARSISSSASCGCDASASQPTTNHFAPLCKINANVVAAEMF